VCFTLKERKFEARGDLIEDIVREVKADVERAVTCPEWKNLKAHTEDESFERTIRLVVCSLIESRARRERLGALFRRYGI
jgi:hypothetical protein